jgi:HNH endonuclease
VIYVGTTFFATAKIATNAVRRPDWGPRAYSAGLVSVKLIKPPIGLETIKKRVPSLTWANYPRGITTPAPEVAAKIRRLIGQGNDAFEPDDEDATADIEMILNDRRIKAETTRRALIEARLGQGRFRTDVIERWGGACAVTGCRVPDVLRASHIKPWKISNSRERLDPANGLLLSANIDALFDAGLVTFDAHGKMIVSSLLSTDERKSLGLPRNLTRPPDRTERSYLAEHRRSRFNA